MPLVEIESLSLYAKQYRAIYDPARVVLIEASTKSGKTTGCLIWQLDQCCRTNGHHWWVAPVYRQAAIAFERAKKMLPDETIKRANSSNQSIELVNGSIWAFRSGENPDNLYGEDVQSVVIDEASRCRPETWPAVRSVLSATRGPCRIIGNVKGRKNWFYNMSRAAQAGRENHAYHRLTVYDAVDGGIFAKDEIEEARRDLPANVFQELYMAEPTDDGANPFGAGHVRAAEIPALAEGPPVCFGVDLAKSFDWTVIVGLNEDGDVCYLERFQRDWGPTVGFIREIVGDLPTLVDSTGVGDPIVEQLRNQSNVEGFKFTSSSKQQLMEGLALDLQRGDVKIPAGVVIDELLTFEYVHTRTGVRYSAPPGLHDDCVCALALARMQFRNKLEVVWWS